jgi:hypothetical protein
LLFGVENVQIWVLVFFYREVEIGFLFSRISLGFLLEVGPAVVLVCGLLWVVVGGDEMVFLW